MSTEYETLLRESIATNAATNAALVRVVETLELTAAQAEARRTDVATQHRTELLEQRQRIDQLTETISRQTAAVEARTELWAKIAESLRSRWVCLLIGLSAGLGLAGGGQLLQTTVAALVGEVPVSAPEEP